MANEMSDINHSMLRIISQYNHNQEDYHRNMASLIDIMHNISTQRNSYTVEFGLTDTANLLLSLMDPSRNVVGGLSATDISNGTIVYTYQPVVDISNGLIETTFTCPITLESVQPGESIIKINHCRHRFKEMALRRWFENHQRCPVCRGGV